MAASLTLGTSATVFAAPPGSPFYNARLVIEMALLPTQADARLAAREDHLDDRLREVEAAAATGDTGAIQAALIAYRSEVDAAVGSGDEDLARVAHLQAALEKHVAQLQKLAARLPNEVAPDKAVERAIDASRKAVDKLKDKTRNGGTRPTPKPDQGDGDSGGNPNPPEHRLQAATAPHEQSVQGSRP